MSSRALGIAVLGSFSSLVAQQWQPLPGRRQPPAGHVAMAADLVRQRLLCVVDEVTSALGPNPSSRCSTWEWDGVTWRARPTATSLPSDGRHHAMAWDPTKDRVLRLGHHGGTWSFDGADWRSEGLVGLDGIDGGSLVFDPLRGVLVAVSGGSLYERVGAAWVLRAPVPGGVLEARAAFDPATGTTLVFGGAHPGSGYSTRTLTWNGTAFTELFPTTTPLPRTDHVLVLDPASNRVLMLGGNGPIGGATPLSHAWSGTDWLPFTAPLPPSPWFGAAPFAGALHLYGGAEGLVRLAAGAWTAVARVPGSGPAAHDPLRVRTVWVANGRTVEFDGRTCSDVGVFPGVEPVNGMAWHPGSARIVTLDSTGTTWTWNGVAWASPVSALNPAPRHSAGLALDEGRGVLVLAGGIGSQGGLDDLWEWDGVTWSNPPSPTPSVPGRAALGFDPSGGTIVRAYYGQSHRLVGSQWVPLPGVPGGNVASIASDGTTLWMLSDLVGSYWARTYSLQAAGWQALPSLDQLHWGWIVFDAGRGAIVQHGNGDLVMTTAPATAAAIGGGCTLAAVPPRLAAAALPQLGFTATLDVIGAQGNGAAFLFFDGAPAVIALPNGCVQHVANPVLLAALPTNAGGFATVDFAVPMAPALRGLTLHTQALALASNGALLAFADLTGGLRLQLGD